MPFGKLNKRPDASSPDVSEGEEKSLGALFTEMMDAYKLKDKVYELKIAAIWNEILGAPVAKYTGKIFLSSGRLTVELNSSVLRNELYLAKEKIISSLNERLGGDYIKELVLK